jgi:hypothetical protein
MKRRFCAILIPPVYDNYKQGGFLNLFWQTKNIEFKIKGEEI